MLILQYAHAKKIDLRIICNREVMPHHHPKENQVFCKTLRCVIMEMGENN